MDLDAKPRPVAEALLTQGEELRGVCVATQVGMFKGRHVLLGVTDRRLLVQGMNRKFEPVGEPISMAPERIADASAEGAGGGWISVGLAIMDGAAVTLKDSHHGRRQAEADDDAWHRAVRVSRRRRDAAPRRRGGRRLVRRAREVAGRTKSLVRSQIVQRLATELATGFQSLITTGRRLLG